MTQELAPELTAFIGRYVELWNEPDAGQRRQTIEALWAPGGANCTPAMEAVGYDELEARVTRSYDAYIGPGEYRFCSASRPAAHHGAVKVHWEMIKVADGTVASTGLEFLILGDDGRIVSDHQFIVS
jgi:hypothetical protein